MRGSKVKRVTAAPLFARPHHDGTPSARRPSHTASPYGSASAAAIRTFEKWRIDRPPQLFLHETGLANPMIPRTTKWRIHLSWAFLKFTGIRRPRKPCRNPLHSTLRRG